MSNLSVATAVQPKTALTRVAEPRTVDPQAVEKYFNKLKKNDLNQFEQNWRDLRSCRSFNAQDWNFVLYHIAEQLPEHPQADEKRTRELREFIHRNFDAWENGATQQIRNAQKRGISISIWAMAILNETPSDEFIEKWKSRALTLSKTFQSQDFANCLWSLAILDALNSDVNYKPIYEVLREKLHRTEFNSNVHAKQIYDADLHFTEQSPVENPVNLEAKSKSELRLSSLFQKAKFTVFKPETCIIPGFEQAIDFAVEKKNRRIAVEVDGPFHFWGSTVNQRQAAVLTYDSTTLFRTSLMVQRAPTERIVRIDHNFLDRLLNRPAHLQTQVCSLIFNAAQAKEPDCYSIHVETPMLRSMTKTSGGLLIPEQS